MAIPTYDVTKIKRHAYVATFGETVIAPLAGAPRISADNKLSESMIYENGGAEAVASILTRNAAVIELETKDIETAMTLLAEFATGDDVMASAHRKALTFTPVKEGEKTLIFPAASLQPSLSYIPAMGGDHTATLSFKAVPDANGKLFTFSA